MSGITYLTRGEYMSLVKKYEGGHWTPDTIEQRWEYHSRVVELVKSFNIIDPHSVLEMGTMGISCVKDSDTLDYLERWDFPDKKPTYVHDSRITPWPIQDKQYDVFIALRVYQHLTPHQKEATREAMRIARRVIIVVPDVYTNREIPASRGITYRDFVDFLDGIHPNLYFPTRNEFLYYWDVGNPSRFDLEVIMRRTYFGGHQALPSKLKEKNAVKRLIGKGLKISRKIVNLYAGKMMAGDDDKPPRRNASRHIEFIGPAGIGKSTIYEEVKRHVIGDWYYREHLQGMLEKYGDDGEAARHLQLLHGKLDHFDRYNLSGYGKLKLIWFFTDILLKDLAMSNNGSLSKKFLLDEGLCHNFSEELMDLPDADLKVLMKERAFVFVQARDNSIIVDRIRKREGETGRKVMYHVGLDDDALKELSDASTLLFNAFMERVETLGVPVCRIFAEDDFQTNIKRVLDFERNIVFVD